MLDILDSQFRVNLAFFPLNKTVSEISPILLSLVWTCIGVNNIETSTPEGWFGGVHGIRGGVNS